MSLSTTPRQSNILTILKRYIKTHYPESMNDINLNIRGLDKGLCHGLSLLWSCCDNQKFNEFMKNIQNWKEPETCPDLERVYGYINTLQPTPYMRAKSWRKFSTGPAYKVNLLLNTTLYNCFSFGSYFKDVTCIQAFLEKTLKKNCVYDLLLQTHALGLKYDGKTYQLYDSNIGYIRSFNSCEELATAVHNQSHYYAKDKRGYNPERTFLQLVVMSDKKQSDLTFPSNEELLRWCPESAFKLKGSMEEASFAEALIKHMEVYHEEKNTQSICEQIIWLSDRGLDVSSLLAKWNELYDKEAFLKLTMRASWSNTDSLWNSANLGKALAKGDYWKDLSKQNKLLVLREIETHYKNRAQSEFEELQVELWSKIALLSYQAPLNNILMLAKDFPALLGQIIAFTNIDPNNWRSDHKQIILNLCPYHLEEDLLLKIIENADAFGDRENDWALSEKYGFFLEQYTHHATLKQITSLFQKQSSVAKRLALMETLLPHFPQKKLVAILGLLNDFLGESAIKHLFDEPGTFPETWRILSKNPKAMTALYSAHKPPSLQLEQLVKYPDSLISHVLKTSPESYNPTHLAHSLAINSKWLALNDLIDKHPDASVSFTEQMLIDVCKKGKAIEQWPKITKLATAFIQDNASLAPKTLLTLLSNATSLSLKQAWRKGYQSGPHPEKLLIAMIDAFIQKPSLMKSSMPFFLENMKSNRYFQELLNQCKTPQTKKAFLQALITTQPALKVSHEKYLINERDKLSQPENIEKTQPADLYTQLCEGVSFHNLQAKTPYQLALKNTLIHSKHDFYHGECTYLLDALLSSTQELDIKLPILLHYLEKDVINWIIKNPQKKDVVFPLLKALSKQHLQGCYETLKTLHKEGKDPSALDALKKQLDHTPTSFVPLQISIDAINKEESFDFLQTEVNTQKPNRTEDLLTKDYQHLFSLSVLSKLHHKVSHSLYELLEKKVERETPIGSNRFLSWLMITPRDYQKNKRIRGHFLSLLPKESQPYHKVALQNFVRQNSIPSLTLLQLLFILTFPIRFCIAVVPFGFSHLLSRLKPQNKSNQLLGPQKNQQDFNPIKSNQGIKVSVLAFLHSFQKTKPAQESKVAKENQSPTIKTNKGG